MPPLLAGPSTNWIVPFPTGRGPSNGDMLPDYYSYHDRLLVSFTVGGILTSFDGEVWTRAFTINSGEYRQAHFVEANNLLYAISSGRTLTSEDGLLWTPQSSTPKISWLSVAYGNGQFAAVTGDTFTGSPNSVYLASDATEWTANPLPDGVSGIALVFARDHFVLLSSSGAWLSADGANWQHHGILPRPESTEESAAWKRLWYFHDRCFALDYNALSAFAVSEDGGVTWNRVDLGGQYFLNDLTCVDGRYLAVGRTPSGSGVVGYSDDGRHWTFAPGPDNAVFVRVTHVNGRFVARTVSSSAGYPSDYVTFTSKDGIRWDSPNHGRHDLNAVAATPNGFVAVGQRGTILSSPNGLDWQLEASGTTNDLLGVGSGNGLIIATGAGETILTSPDAHAWTLRPHPATQPAGVPLYGVDYARGRYVIAGAYLSSTNGVDWEAPPGEDHAPSNSARSIADDGRQFQFIGYVPDPSGSGSIQSGRSIDGRTWSFTPTDRYGTSLAFGNGTYVLIGNGQAAISTNGVDWQPFPRLTPLQSVIYIDSEFVGVADDGTVGSSPDGLHWTYGNCPGRTTAIAGRDGVYVAVGPRGMLYCSRPEGTPRLAQAGWVPGYGFHLGLAGVPGRAYRVQYTTDGGTWNDLTSVQSPIFGISPPLPVDNLVRVLDPDATADSGRWYRVIEE